MTELVTNQVKRATDAASSGITQSAISVEYQGRYVSRLWISTPTTF